MDNIKRIENPGQFLMDTGLLFEITRRIFHPLGMALEVVQEEGGEVHIGGIWDYRDDIEGIHFDEGKTFTGGLEKWERFQREYGDAATEARREVLGYVVQGEG
jgi:hypothetical protein